MRSILTTVITCLLLSSYVSGVTAHSVNKQEDVSSSDSEQQSPKKAKRDRGDDRGEPLDFSGMGRPGQQTAGESRGSCANAGLIEALLPVSMSGKTVQGHPSFWVHFPDTFPPASQVEFILQDESRKDVWRSRSKLDNKPGYKSFSLPETESPLEIGQWYRWYVKVYCDSQISSAQYVQGWVNRTPLTSGLHLELQENEENSHLVYGNHVIWYDAINQLLSSYQNNPTDLTLEQDWHNLLGAEGVSLDLLPSIGGSYKTVKSPQ